MFTLPNGFVAESFLDFLSFLVGFFDDMVFLLPLNIPTSQGLSASTSGRSAGGVTASQEQLHQAANFPVRCSCPGFHIEKADWREAG